MTRSVSPLLTAIHRAAAQAGSLRSLLEGAVGTIRGGLELPWVLALVRDPVTAQVRSSVVEGVAGGSATLLMRRAAKLSEDDLTQGRVSVAPVNPVGDVIAVTGTEHAAVALLRDEHHETMGFVLLGLTSGQAISDDELTQIAETFSCEVLRANRDESTRRRAHYDPATGLPGSILLATAVDAAPADQETCLLLVSVDQLQSVTRSLGTAAGNEMLRKVALRLLLSGEAGAWSVFRLARGFGVLTVGPSGTGAAAARQIMTT
ncbi:MAG: hypothetical protein QOE64_1381, partial [Frankiales bacterium]|nr:hypothetical protein [Frankiales bacterium]